MSGRDRCGLGGSGNSENYLADRITNLGSRGVVSDINHVLRGGFLAGRIDQTATAGNGCAKWRRRWRLCARGIC